MFVMTGINEIKTATHEKAEKYPDRERTTATANPIIKYLLNSESCTKSTSLFNITFLKEIIKNL